MNTEMETKVKQEVTPVLYQAQAFEVTTDSNYEDGGKLLVAIRAMRKRVKQEIGPAVKQAHQAWKEVKALENKFDKPLDQAERQVKAKLADYKMQREREIQEAQRKAEEEAMRKAEAARLEEAEALEKFGSDKAAAAILETPIVPEVVKPVEEAPQAEGVSTRQIWKAEVEDMKLLCTAIAEGKAAENCVKPDTKVLGQLAKALKGNMNIPGVKVYSETSVAVRG